MELSGDAMKYVIIEDRLLRGTEDEGARLSLRTTNWIKPLHKGENINNIHNYRTIMIGSIMAKLFRCIMESRVKCMGLKNGKRVYGQVGF